MSELIKNMEHSKSVVLADLVEYQEGKVASLTLSQKAGVGITVFAFDANEGISTHAAPGDAMAYILDGEAKITIDGTDYIVRSGEAIVMPSKIPHAVKAVTRFKMLLTVVKDL